MVNRGRPSKDCAPCRRRKLRCDLCKEGCGQCRRAGLTCFGYRDPKDLIFQDQTQSVRSKAQRRFRVHSPPSPSRQPRLSWTVLARHDFFTHYVFGLSRSYDMLGLLYGAASQGDHLNVSVDATSLAFMAMRYSSAPDLMQQAAERYVVALRLVNKALAAAEAATADDTLQSVLLLDLYEKLVSRNPHSATSWLRHMHGAIALIEMRGKRNLHTYIGRRLAQRLYTCLVISCGVAGVRVPRELDSLKQELDSFYDKVNDPKWAVTTLNVQAINFVASIKEGKQCAAGHVVAEAERLDGQFRHVQESLPAAWQPTRVMLHESSVAAYFMPEDGYDVYENLFYTQVRNVIRIMRIHLHLFIKRYSDPTDTKAGVSCTTFIESNINGICASATQFLAPGASSDNTTPFSLAQSLKCYTLLAPLYLAGSVSCNPSTRNWVIHVLKYMATAGGLEMAHQTAAALETSSSTNFWDVYAMLGSYAFAA